MRPLAASLLPLALLACSTPAPSPAPQDAAAPDVTADAAPDAAPDTAPDTAPADVAPDAPAGPPSVTWESVTLPSMGPVGRWGLMIADVGDGTAFVYGGTSLTAAGGGTTSNELWRFDGRGDAPSFERVAATGDAPPRYCGCVGYLPDSQTVLMIGGRNPNEAPAETWAMREGAWSRVMAPTTPPGVIGCAMAWSRARGALYLFGGGGAAAGFSSRVWRYDPAAAWVMLDAMGPRGRYDDALVPLPDGRTLLMVAGARGAQAGTGFYNDVWRFDTMDETWQQVMTTGEAPPGRRNPWVSLDADGNGFVMALGSTGIQAGEVLDDAWYLDLRTGAWTALAPEALPPARGFSMALPGRGAVPGYVFAGFDNARPIRDAWRLRQR